MGMPGQHTTHKGECMRGAQNLCVEAGSSHQVRRVWDKKAPRVDRFRPLLPTQSTTA